MRVLGDALSGQREHFVPLPSMLGPHREKSGVQGPVGEICVS